MASTTKAIRITWNAVTSGTPTSSTLAVMHISAMPPGVVPRITVAGCAPDSADSPQPTSADTTSASTV